MSRVRWPLGSVGTVSHSWTDGLRRRGYLVGTLAAVLAFTTSTLPLVIWPSLAQDGRAGVLLFGTSSAAALVWVVRYPVVVLAAEAAVLMVATAVGVRFTPLVSNAGPALAVAVFMVALLRPSRVSVPAAVAAVLAVCGVQVAALALRWHPDHDQEAIQLFLGAAAFALGILLRSNASYRAALADERDRSVRADERLRLSRDVHDLVSHALSAIAVRAGSGRLLASAQPHLAAAALADIEQTSRSALAELREVLRGWRSTAEPARPGLADLSALGRILTPSGRTLELAIDGTPHELPQALQVAVYRIAQEAVTNAGKHSRAGSVRLQLTFQPELLRLEVADDGPAAMEPGVASGHGLAGIRERVALLGGQVTAGPQGDGGFAVRVAIPLPDNNDGRPTR